MSGRMRLGVYTDYVYRQVDDVIYAERAFALFLAALGPLVGQLTLIGRLAPSGEARYELPATLSLAPLRHYGSLANPAAVLRALLASIRQMWRALDDVDLLWVLGPYPHALVFVLLARLRGRPVVLGVRQNWPQYVRNRHPQRGWMHRASDVMEWAWMWLARRRPVVAVGSELAAKYAHAPAVLNLAVSLMPASAILPGTLPDAAAGQEPHLDVLSVGRLDAEKNPLLLADVLAILGPRDPRWRLLVCGEGSLSSELSERLEELDVADRARLLGYVPMGNELLDLYRSSYAMLHVSWTEGFPQVLIEAFATGLPVVATAVGGVAGDVGDAAILIPPGDASAAAAALTRLAGDEQLRAELRAAGLRRAAELTLENQADRLTAFLAGFARSAVDG